MTPEEPSHQMSRLCHRIATTLPVRVPAPSPIANALAGIDPRVDPEDVTTALALLGVGLAVFVLAVLAMAGVDRLRVPILVLALGSGGATALSEARPRIRGAQRRARQVGALPAFVSRVTLGMRLTPTLEAGIDAAFRTTGPLTRRVPRRHGRAAEDVLHDAVDALGPHAARAEGLLDAAPTATDHHRLLDRAVATVLDGTRDRVREYTTALHGPVTALYAFGVVLPLALVGILPAAPLAGYRIPLAALAVVLDLVLPMALVAGTAWLVARRPAVNRPPRLPTSHPALGNPGIVGASGFLGVAAGLGVATAFPAWATWFVPIAWGAGGLLLARYQPAGPVLESLQRTHEGVPDLLTLVGDAMADGAPPERALETAASVPGTAGNIASDAATIRQRLGVPVGTALFGDAGPLAVLDPGDGAALEALLETATAGGEAGGRALTRYATHLDALHDLERETRADLARLTGSLHQTAALYAPAIAGVTVALATRLRGTAQQLDTAGTGFPLVVGGYVLVLAVVLPASATAITRGWCRVRIGTRVGRALLLAGAGFPAVAQFAGHLL